MYEHCTGFIKLTKDYSDIYFAHDAWSTYLDLHGALKEYDIPAPGFVARRVVMSTRPGKLSSYDDYYLTDSGLFVLETTMTVFNQDLYEFTSAQSVFTWLRATHATWTAHNGSDWTKIFIRPNSGTYNNQYLIVDTNRFERYKKPERDLLWVIEQYPGDNWRSADITEKLVSDTWFGSINKPSFKDLYVIAGYPDKVASMGEQGNFYTYETSARYLLMQREGPRLDDFELFKAFMRYNNWRRDPYSNGDASQQIMSRYDQRRYKDPYGDAKMFGGLDSKAARLTEVRTKLAFHAIGSPSYDNNPVWNFSGSAYATVDHDGLPDVWNFSWIQFGADHYGICEGRNSDDCKDQEYCGWCSGQTSCLPGDKDGPFFGVSCSSGWSAKGKFPDWAIGVIVAGVLLVLAAIIIAVVLVRRRRRQRQL
jgi:hypothetical protein